MVAITVFILYIVDYSKLRDHLGLLCLGECNLWKIDTGFFLANLLLFFFIFIRKSIACRRKYTTLELLINWSQNLLWLYFEQKKNTSSIPKTVKYLPGLAASVCLAYLDQLIVVQARWSLILFQPAIGLTEPQLPETGSGNLMIPPFFSVYQLLPGWVDSI